MRRCLSSFLVAFFFLSALPVSAASLTTGSRGEEVRSLQQSLASDPTLYPEGLITGYYGKATESAVKRFQKKYGIVSSGDAKTTGYGAVGRKTQTMIEKVFGKGHPSVSGAIVPSAQNPFLNPTTSRGTSTVSFLDTLPRALPPDCASQPPNQRDTCWQTKAHDEQNISYCTNITQSSPFVSRNACINLIAQAKKDASLCIRITDAEMKKNCENLTR